MVKALLDRLPPVAHRDLADPYWNRTKVSDDLLEPVLRAFFRSMSLYNDLPKSRYYELVRFLEPEEVHSDVVTVLDAIADHQQRARPV